MKTTVIITICVICMIMTSAMFAAGYSSWTEYKNANSVEQIGEDVITAIDGTTAKIANTTDKVAQFIEDPEEKRATLNIIIKHCAKTEDNYTFPSPMLKKTCVIAFKAENLSAKAHSIN